MTSAVPVDGNRDSAAATQSEVFFYLLLGIVALVPLPLASNRPLPAAILALCAGVLLIAWSLCLAFTGRGLNIRPRLLLWPLLLFFGVCLWIAIQWMPAIPFGLADPAWKVAGDALKEPLPGRISVNPSQTLTGLMHLLSYAAVFWLSLQLNHNSDRAYRSILAVTYIGCAYSLYGLIIYVTGNHWILIYPKWAYLDVLTSTFVNRNSYATFAGLCLLCAAGVFRERIKNLLHIARPAREKFVILVEHIVARSSLLTVAVFSIAVALVLTASRAGVGFSYFALLLFLLIPTDNRGVAVSRILIVMGSMLLIMLLALITGGGGLYDRSDTGFLVSSIAGRTGVYQMVWEAIQSSPLTGTGFGTFPDVFTAYRAENLISLVSWDKAHNTYLENALELGIPAAICLNLAILLLAVRCALGLIERRRDRLYPAIGLASTILVALHSWFDFSLQMPAVSVLYAFIMGVAVSQSWSSAKRG